MMMEVLSLLIEIATLVITWMAYRVAKASAK